MVPKMSQLPLPDEHRKARPWVEVEDCTETGSEKTHPAEAHGRDRPSPHVVTSPTVPAIPLPSLEQPGVCPQPLSGWAQSLSLHHWIQDSRIGIEV